MTKYNNNFQRFFFTTLDLFMLNIVHILLMYNIDRIDVVHNQAYAFYILFCNIAWLVCALGTQLYIYPLFTHLSHFGKKSFKTLLFYGVVILLFLFVYHYSYSRIFIGLSLGGFAFMIGLSRLLIFLGRSYLREKEDFNKKVIVIGYNRISKKLVHYFSLGEERVHMEGYFENFDKIHELSDYPIIGDIQDTLDYAIENEVDEIYSTISPERNPSIYKLAAKANKNLIHFRFVPDFRSFVNRNYHLEYVQEIPVLSLRPEPLEKIEARFKKRLFDIFFSAGVILFLLSWLVPIIAVLVKLSSNGPVFFVQERSGRDNKNFKCYKFRSLRVGNPNEAKQVSKKDSRVTKIGHFLRKSNLDELPQFFNVFIGNMSLVGPRPHMLEHTLSFSKRVDDYMLRHFVKPGITGWAQINGYRGEIRETEQLRQRTIYDIWYEENWSLWLDLRIIFRTAYLSIKGDENAF